MIKNVKTNILFAVCCLMLASCGHWQKAAEVPKNQTATVTDPYDPANMQQTEAGFAFPLDEYKLSGKGKFVWRKKRMHKGVDLLAPKGTPIRAIADGEVVFSGRSRGYGLRVTLSHSDGLTTIYAHNTKNLVSNGEKVKKGQVIALVGRTGRATANHLHFEVRIDREEINPLLYLTSGQIEGAPPRKKEQKVAKSTKKKGNKKKIKLSKNKKKKRKVEQDHT